MASPREIADEQLKNGEISQQEHAGLVRRLESPALLDPVPGPSVEKMSKERVMQSGDGGGWFYVSGNEKKGPYDRETMIALARADTIGPDTLVWTSGMKGWEALGTLPLGAEISTLFAAGGPPVPAQSPVRPGNSAAAAVERPVAAAGSSVGFSDAIRLAFQKYTDFSTRIGRPEFWFFVLFSVLGSWATLFLDGLVFGSGLDSFAPINSIFSLALIIPSLSAGARRLHDIDRSGWWQLIGLVPLIGIIVLIVFWCTEGTRGSNRFG